MWGEVTSVWDILNLSCLWSCWLETYFTWLDVWPRAGLRAGAGCEARCAAVPPRGMAGLPGPAGEGLPDGQAMLKVLPQGEKRRESVKGGC